MFLNTNKKVSPKLGPYFVTRFWVQVHQFSKTHAIIFDISLGVISFHFI